jgi:VWFA-related protein
LSGVNDLTKHSCSRRRFLFLPGSLFLARPLLAGQDDNATFSANVKVVNVLASVRAKNGEFIRNLSKDDFSLSENGRNQTIRYFSRESDLPLTLGLMVDTSLSQRRVLDAERAASFRFLDQVLRESVDQVFIVQFDFAIQVRERLTSSRRKLEETLALVDTPSRKELEMQRGGGTLLYDAVVMASQDIMKNQANRKAVIVLTDGVDFGSDATLETATEAAQRADTLVYSILFSDPGAYGFSLGGPDGRKALMRMSKETGGGFFEVSKKQSIEQIFAVIQDELRSQYSLGYVSDEPVRVSEFRGIQLSTKQKGLTVQARDRYWAQR